MKRAASVAKSITRKRTYTYICDEARWSTWEKGAALHFAALHFAGNYERVLKEPESTFSGLVITGIRLWFVKFILVALLESDGLFFV